MGFALKLAPCAIAGALAAQVNDTTRTSTTARPTELGSGLGGAGSLPRWLTKPGPLSAL